MHRIYIASETLTQYRTEKRETNEIKR